MRVDSPSAADQKVERHLINELAASRLRNSVLWNLFGQGSPLLVALVAIPILVNSLGPDRFGILTLAFTLIGYFGLFDLGMGRALTQTLARRLGDGQGADNGRVAWTSLITMFVFSLGIAICVAPGILPLVGFLRLPNSLRPETQSAFLLLLITVPVVVTTAGMRGVLEAYQRFRALNVVRIPLGASIFLAPLCVLPFSRNLTWIIAALLVTRLAAAAAYLYLTFTTIPSFRTAVSFRWPEAVQLLRFGGWMMVSNLFGPVLNYVDRFVVGILLSTAAVAYYATPYEAVAKVLVIPAALAGVLFPAFATLHAMDRERALRVYSQALKYTFIILLPVIFMTIAFSGPALTTWLGPDFAAHSTQVLQVLAVVVFVSAFGQISFALVQGFGRPDLAAKVELIELPLYLVGIWFMVGHFGILGAAVASLIRAAIDAVVLFGLSMIVTRFPTRRLIGVATVVAAGVLLMAIAMHPFSGPLAIAVPVLTLCVFALAVPRFMLSPAERSLLLSGLRLTAKPAGLG